ncbi:hypothetical protein GCM10010124_38850 [Pilimelia terevasa]|uniref:Uncharacterized protein n=1 Tax=Pilimelia terevasa TaxID=53372 RepID=A0A8J3FLF9_9ACTN|nr:hypothetical protein [Pilimelia terevasa]GGK42224.1 hypothetical protein GCM10010124_38850 [Pilimelia terevasa]
MKLSARFGAACVGLLLGGVTALVSVTPASATIPLGGLLGGVTGGSSGGGKSAARGHYDKARSYVDSGGCGTLEIIKKFGLDMNTGSRMSMWDMPDHGSLDEVTAEVDTDGDGRADRKVKVGKDRLTGKKMKDGVWGGSHMSGGKKKYWLASSSGGWNIVRSYATVCSGVAMYVAMNCVCGYGLLGGWMYGYDDDRGWRDHDDRGDRDDDSGDCRRRCDDDNVTPVPGDKGVNCRVTICAGSSASSRDDYDHDDDYDDDDEEYYDDDDSDDDTLPVTGLALGGVVGVGLLLASAGALAIVATRRRRTATADGTTA